MKSIINSGGCNTASSISSAYYFVVGGRNYMTNNYIEDDRPAERFNPELYYPNACLFCGITNGHLIETTTATTTTTIMGTPVAADYHSYLCTTAAPVMHYYTYNNNKASNHRVLPAVEIVKSRVITNNRINSFFKTLKRFMIRKQLYLFSSTNKRRFLTL